MSLNPLFAAPAVIQIHAFAAMAAFALGILQFAAPKGTLPHRTVGWIWVALMGIVAVSAFFIHTPAHWKGLSLFGHFSPIHLLAIFVLAVVPLATWRARQHRVRAHKLWMIGIFTGALLTAGAFTFLPGRIMHAVLIGG